MTYRIDKLYSYDEKWHPARIIKEHEDPNKIYNDLVKRNPDTDYRLIQIREKLVRCTLKKEV